MEPLAPRSVLAAHGYIPYSHPFTGGADAEQIVPGSEPVGLPAKRNRFESSPLDSSSYISVCGVRARGSRSWNSW